MSLSTSSHPAHHKPPVRSVSSTRLKTRGIMAMTIAVASVITTGCSTTHELKPTASVIVGGHKSI